MEPTTPVLYILMRCDMASLALSIGKVAAQASHAANAMVYEARDKDDDAILELLDVWENETPQGFGTAIVLAVTEEEMRRTVAAAKELNLHTGIIHDPTYPLLDGKALLIVPVDTCAYIFAKKDDAKILLENFLLFSSSSY